MKDWHAECTWLIHHFRFLWVRLQLEVLLDECQTPGQVRKALKNFPIGLNEIYHRCLTRPIGHAAQFTRRILEWICAAPEPMQVDHIRELLAFKEDERDLDHGDMPSSAIVQRAATNLITLEQTGFDAVEYSLVPVHSTVRDFVFSAYAQDTLAGRATNPIEKVTKPDELLRSTTARLGRTFLAYLSAFSGREIVRKRISKAPVNLSDVEKSMPPLARKISSMARRRVSAASSSSRTGQIKVDITAGKKPANLEVRLVDYARRNWFECLRCCDPGLFPDEDLRWLLFENEDTLTLPWTIRGRPKTQGIRTLIAWAVAKEHLPMLQFTIRIGTQLDLFKEEYLRSQIFAAPMEAYGEWPPLNFASKAGNADIVEELIPFCDRITFSPRTNRSPLHEAALSDEEVVYRLLDAYDDPALLLSKDTQGCVPLHLAAQSGNTQSCAALLEEMAKLPNLEPLEDCNGRSPFSYALECRDRDLFLAFLTYPALEVTVKTSRNFMKLTEGSDLFKIMLEAVAQDLPIRPTKTVDLFAVLLCIATRLDDPQTGVLNLIAAFGSNFPAFGIVINHLYDWANTSSSRFGMLKDAFHSAANRDLSQITTTAGLNFLGHALVLDDISTVSLLCSIHRSFAISPVGIPEALSVLQLLESQGYPEFATRVMESPLKMAAYLGNLNTLKTCAKFQDEELNLAPLGDITPLHIAAIAPYDPILKYLCGRREFDDEASPKIPGVLWSFVVKVQACWAALVLTQPGHACFTEAFCLSGQPDLSFTPCSVLCKNATGVAELKISVRWDKNLLVPRFDILQSSRPVSRFKSGSVLIDSLDPIGREPYERDLRPHHTIEYGASVVSDRYSCASCFLTDEVSRFNSSDIQNSKD